MAHDCVGQTDMWSMAVAFSNTVRCMVKIDKRIWSCRLSWNGLGTLGMWMWCLTTECSDYHQTEWDYREDRRNIECKYVSSKTKYRKLQLVGRR